MRQRVQLHILAARATAKIRLCNYTHHIAVLTIWPEFGDSFVLYRPTLFQAIPFIVHSLYCNAINEIIVLL